MDARSSTWPGRSRWRRRAVLGVVAALAVAAAPAASGSPRGIGDGFDFQNELRGDDYSDLRPGRLAPTRAQLEAAAASGATVRWTQFGTPHVVTRAGGDLASGLGDDAVAAARAYLRANRELFRLSGRSLDALELVNDAPIGAAGHAVLLRQRFGDLPAAGGGLVAVGVREGRVVFVSSTLAPDGAAPEPATLTGAAALSAAARDAGLSISAVTIRETGRDGGWIVYEAPGLGEARAKLVAVPMPSGGPRTAWETSLADDQARIAYSHQIDARNAKVLLRKSLVNHAVDDPEWKVFPAYPPLDYSSNDTRELWCWIGTAGCERVIGTASAHLPWDVNPHTGASTHTTIGNSAESYEKWFSRRAITAPRSHPATPSPTREYVYPWTNQWFESGCDPNAFFTPQQADFDAAATNLFSMHNRMHDWAYYLGFTEPNFNMQEKNFKLGGRPQDPELGMVQSGAVAGGFPNFFSRDNANQITFSDGGRGISNMYMWQPIPGSFYSPCVDGDFDGSVIAHEYGHAISNRMIAGPDDGYVSFRQTGAMGESWSDLDAMEYMNEHGFVPIADENPYAVGAYVTGDKQAAIRNYGMNFSPLNYTDIGYDVTGPQVHADGEIWSAVNFDVRSAYNAKYDATFPSSDAALQYACAFGEHPPEQCPGNRRWAQIMFDAFLLMASPTPSMVDMRDAYLAADVLRTGGVDLDVLWNGFASGGLGAGASSATFTDNDPVPSFVSPFAEEGTVELKPRAPGGSAVTGAHLYIGDYEARAVPIADTDAATPRAATADMLPGTYPAIVHAPGYGHKRITLEIRAGRTTAINDVLRPNLAAAANGATATGDGVNQALLIDETEATNWASLGAPVQGKQVTVDLAGDGAESVRRVQVSAMIRPANPVVTPPPVPPDPDPGPQSRFSALRSFEILTCRANAGTDCSADGDFTLLYTSPADAFPAVRPRPRAPQLIIRSFDVPDTSATHVRLRVVDNQCTGAPDYQGEQDNDPRYDTDCSENSFQAFNVRAAELQVFDR